MIQNYIFDLYGTLVDIHTDESMPILWRRMALLLSLQGASYTPEELKSAYSAAVQTQIEQRSAKLPGIIKTDIEPDISAAFASLYTGKGVAGISDERVMDTALFFRTLSIRHLCLYPGAQMVLNTLRKKGKGIYLLSNAQAAFTIPELQKLGLLPAFDGIVISSEVGVKKPNKYIFEYTLSKYGLHPATCLMVGNDEQADMRGAASVGMEGRYIHTKQSPPRQGPLPRGCREMTDLSQLL